MGFTQSCGSTPEGFAMAYIPCQENAIMWVPTVEHIHTTPDGLLEKYETGSFGQREKDVRKLNLLNE